MGKGNDDVALRRGVSQIHTHIIEEGGWGVIKCEVFIVMSGCVLRGFLGAIEFFIGWVGRGGSCEVGKGRVQGIRGKLAFNVKYGVQCAWDARGEDGFPFRMSEDGHDVEGDVCRE